MVVCAVVLLLSAPGAVCAVMLLCCDVAAPLLPTPLSDCRHVPASSAEACHWQYHCSDKHSEYNIGTVTRSSTAVTNTVSTSGQHSGAVVQQSAQWCTHRQLSVLLGD